ncbi:MAG: rhodanese-like domain-containing protein [Gammaproteobacteria bacterium]|nr:rhodanese-like domain-containing protein [Gammaproteobacteria bacterium]
MSHIISAQQAMKLVNEAGAQLVDVRNPAEYASGAAPGAINIPVSHIPHLATTHLDESKPVVVYCLSGGRSEQARMILQAMGFRDVYNAGGVKNFMSA